MSCFGGVLKSPLGAAVMGALAVAVSACGSSDHQSSPPPQLFAVLSAFPAELAPLVEHATVEETLTIDGRIFRRGTLGGAPVVIAMTGIGLVNATATTLTLLEHFEVTSIVFSGVAGSTRRIGDVTVPEVWQADDGSTYPVSAPYLELAEDIAAPGGVALEQCTLLPRDPARGPVCMPQPPAVVVGGIGHSSDPYNGIAQPCRTNTGDLYADVFGCDIDTPAAGGAATLQATAASLDAETPVTEDMETAAVAAEAAARKIPFIAFRAVSDGDGDPLMLTGAFTQFFAYYRLAARNAAAATIAFLERAAER